MSQKMHSAIIFDAIFGHAHHTSAENAVESSDLARTMDRALI